MKKFLLVILTFTVLLLGSEIKSVKSTGYGENQDKALDNALKEGLARVVGMYMSSSSFVKNYQTINDEITSFSNGFIKDYNIDSVEKGDDGLFVINVSMNVKTGKVITKLKELNIASKKFSVNSANLKKSTKMQGIKKINADKFAEEFSNQIVEPIKQNKSHFIKIIKSEAFEITDIADNKNITLKSLDDSHTESLVCSKFVKGDKGFDFMDNYYLIKVNYEFGLTDEYYNNCVSFFDAALNKVEGDVRVDDLGFSGKIIVSKTSGLAKRQIADNVYSINKRGIHNIKKYLRSKKGYHSFKLETIFSAYDKNGFPIQKFKYIRGSSRLSKHNNIMTFEPNSILDRMKVPYAKKKEFNSDKFYDLNSMCKGIFSCWKGMMKVKGVNFTKNNNLYFLKDDLNINFDTYLVVKRDKIAEIGEIKGEILTK